MSDEEIKRLENEVEELNERIDNQNARMRQLLKDLLRIWHIGIGIMVGLLLDKMGLEAIIKKLF